MSKLWEERYWRLLVHYEKGLFGWSSEVGSAEFFLSPHGRTDPQVELEATIQAFFAPQKEDRDAHPQCQFPARLAWLRERLGIDSTRLPIVDCPHFNVWKEDLNAHSVTLIFASAYLNNPSSMYGHTFLRLDQESHGARERLLDNAVNFAAVTKTDNGILFAIDGLIGMFPGRFSAMPYYLKVREYNNLESRNLWEYPLSLSEADVHRMVLHIWEMGHADFPYYFFNKNCSYQLLPLLEVAKPDLHLVDHWPLYVIPVDTLRTVIDSGLAGQGIYRPSQVTRMLYERETLTGSETKLVSELARGQDSWGDLKNLPGDRQAAVLNSALDYLQYLVDYRRDRTEQTKSLRGRLLDARSKLGIASPALTVPSPQPPETGHKTGRLMLGYGYEKGSFLEVAWRPALHDLLDREEGYIPGSELEMLNARFGYDFRSQHAYLRNLDMVNLTSLTPLDPWIRKPSWEIQAGWKTADDLDPRPGKAGYAGLTLGSGLAAATHSIHREVWYALLEGDAGVGGILQRDYRLGGGPKGGVQITLASWWRSRFEGAYFMYALGDRRSHLRLRFDNALDLSKDLSLRAYVQGFGTSREYFIGPQYYF